MTFRSVVRGALIGGAALGLAGCGGPSPGDPGAAPPPGTSSAQRQLQNAPGAIALEEQERKRGSSTIWDLFRNVDDPSVTVAVNKYLWQASLEILNFLPIRSVDPFTGVIVTDFGTPPGGGRAYRATVYVQDPALEARSLKVALATRGGTVDPQTVRAVEDAILTRARQLRIRDGDL